VEEFQKVALKHIEIKHENTISSGKKGALDDSNQNLSPTRVNRSRSLAGRV
jgi:hypothetical protein